MSEEKKYYVYVHKYASGPKEGQVFYVGKGSGGRCIAKCSRSSHWHSIVEKYGFSHKKVMSFRSEVCAFSFEKVIINSIGFENLCNQSTGGDGGATGYKFDRSVVLSKAEKCMKPVINSDGNVFSSLKEAAKFCRSNGYGKATESHISSCCNGGRHMAYGFSWSFEINKTPDLIDSSGKVNEGRLIPVVASSGVEFDSVSEAASWVRDVVGVKCGTSDISRCCKGKRKTCGGLTWRYKNCQQ